MTILLATGCLCGKALERPCAGFEDVRRAQDEWRREHSGPGHGPCGADEARRRAKRDRRVGVGK